MCPACLANAAWIVGGAISTSGASALLVKTFRFKSTNTDSKQRRKQDGDGNKRETGREGGVPSGMGEGAPGIVNQGEGVHASSR
jgi:hypothetical protein